MSCYLLSPHYYRIWLTLSLWLGLCLLSAQSQAAQWLSIKKTDHNQLMIDKQSLLEEKPYVKAWVKVDYSNPQKNVESVDRVYNHAKALWYFNCETRKAATIQVFQYEDDELVYSAGTTAKQADFIEPLPESEVEIAQQYACKWQAKEKQRIEAAARHAANPVVPAVASKKDKPAGPGSVAEPAPAADTAKPEDKPAKESKPAEEITTPTQKPAASTAAEKSTPANKAEKPVSEKDKKEKEKEKEKEKHTKTDKPNDKAWSYSGVSGPDKWSSLNPDFAACNAGSQQSPINIDNTITAALKPLKKLQKFPLKNIALKDHSLILDAGSGNMMVLDQKPYQLQYISVHVPSEHQIKQKSYAAELHMVHEDKAGHRVIIAVMLEEGTSNSALEKLLSTAPKEQNQSKPLAIRVTPGDLMPSKPAYYRYSGSLTAPPCTEGVQWVIMKETLKISKFQLGTLEQIIGGPNQRPLQDSQGRMILE